MRSISLATLVACTCLVVGAPALYGQAGGGDPRGLFASREALQTQADDAEKAAAAATDPGARDAKRVESLLIRRRLQEGDFPVGDRIVVTVAGETSLTDTFTVRTGNAVHLGSLAPITLQGVLRGELEQYLIRELSKYIIDPRVTATPLLRVAVMGSVGRPGYLHVPADMILSDLLMAAGGPGTNADVSRSEIRRGAERLYVSRDVQIALSSGMSLDVLSYRSGDELYVPEKRATNWSVIGQGAAVVTGLLGLVVGIAR